jgi:hypothetical protein
MAVLIQLRGDTAANWTSVNPVLAERELAIETDTNLYKIGNGVSEWNDLPYLGFRSANDTIMINFSNQSTPSTPSVNTLNLFARQLGGRMALRAQGPSGLSTPLQPSFFQNFITIINSNATNTIGSIGNTVTSTGTISHPTIDPKYGLMTNFRTAVTAAATAGTGNNGLLWVRSDNSKDAAGFFFNARLAFPNLSYDETGASTGTRIFVGLTNGTLAASVGSNNPAGSRIGFQRLHVNGSVTDTNWHVSIRGGVSDFRIDTGLPFIAECVYDFYIFCPPDGRNIGWRIDNVTLGTSESGELSENILEIGEAFPARYSHMRGGFQLQTVNALARDIQMQRVYIESDR